MLAFLTGLFKRLQGRPVHGGLSHERGLGRVRLIPTADERVTVATIGQNSSRHAFLTMTVPEGANGMPVAEKLHAMLCESKHVLNDESVECPNIIRLVVFLSDVGQIQACRKAVADFYGEQQPVTTFVPQTPCEGGDVAIEIAAADDHATITYRDEHLLIETHDDVNWVHGGQIVSDPNPMGVYERSFSGFLKMRNLLRREKLSVPQIIRTWLYLGDIVGPEDDTQRYKELNRARTDFFNDIDFSGPYTPECYRGAVYPASTGIGANDADVLMEVVALETTRKDVVITPLENPDQVSAFDYCEKYSPKSPKFARATAVMIGNHGTIFVSGTASITEAESRHIEDIEAQTHQTIDNMAVLITRDNLENHGIQGQDATLRDFAVVRAYVKRPSDYEAVRAICEERFGEVPITYTIADVCRPELLVEIEGIAFPRPLINNRDELSAR